LNITAGGVYLYHWALSGKCKIVPVHNQKTYGEVELYFHTFLPLALDKRGGEHLGKRTIVSH